MSNKYAATFHPHDAPTDTIPSRLDLMQANGVDYTDVHGFVRGFVWVIVGVVVFWVVVAVSIWGLTR